MKTLRVLIGIVLLTWTLPVFAVEPDEMLKDPGLEARRQVQIRAVVLLQVLQKAIDLCHCLSTPCSARADPAVARAG